jgi:hypothetical protein
MNKRKQQQIKDRCKQDRYSKNSRDGSKLELLVAARWRFYIVCALLAPARSRKDLSAPTRANMDLCIVGLAGKQDRFLEAFLLA